MAFTSADINKIANKVVDILADVPKGTPEVQQQVNSVELDPMIQVMDRIAEKAMDDLPTGVVAYRGRNGTQIINHSEETINTLDNIRRNRKNFRTRQNVR